MQGFFLLSARFSNRRFLSYMSDIVRFCCRRYKVMLEAVLTEALGAILLTILTERKLLVN